MRKNQTTVLGGYTVHVRTAAVTEFGTANRVLANVHSMSTPVHDLFIHI